jgi:tetratricopeptide (TPR) repeat protein
VIGAAAWAAGPAAAAPDDLIAMRDGPPVQGEIVSVGDDHLQVRTGERLARISFAKVAPGSLYTLLKARTALDDADARLALSETLATYGAFAGARAELRAVKALEPSRRADVGLRLSDLDEKEAKWLYRQGMDHATADPPRWKEAVEAFAAVVDRFAGLPAADKAASKLAMARRELAKQPKEPVKPGPDGAVRKINKRAQAWAAKTVAAAESKLAEAAASNKAALKLDARGDAHKAAKAYHEAADAAGNARAWCTKVLDVAKLIDPKTAGAATAARAKAEKQLSSLYGSLTAVYMVQKNWKLARSYALQALEINPEDRRALDQKMTIEKEMVRERPKDDGTKDDKKTVKSDPKKRGK